ncbi:MAG: RNA 2',3'-cyclic phosphodiesterase [Nitrospirae bacterium]|nr:RNA 2',3'-cyclic phosphodiesterase [Nitrospirota bacterium]
MDMDIRCFIAIELPEEIKKDIDAHVERLKATGADVKWVKVENLHLTLKFLGSAPEKMIPDISRKLLEIAKQHNSFYIRMSGAGVFPNMKFPRIVWLGINDSDEIKRLQRDIDESMKEFGFEPEDRDFSPHLTIGRVRSSRNKDNLMKELTTLKDVDFGNIKVEKITLMKSELKTTGAEYFRLSEIPIGTG